MKTKTEVIKKILEDGLVYGSVYGLAFGSVAGLANGSVAGIVDGLILGLVGLIAGLIAGLVIGLDGLVFGLVFGLIAGLVTVLTTQIIAYFSPSLVFSSFDFWSCLIIIQIVGWIIVYKLKQEEKE